jgi:hypothetical protein
VQRPARAIRHLAFGDDVDGPAVEHHVEPGTDQPYRLRSGMRIELRVTVERSIPRGAGPGGAPMRMMRAREGWNGDEDRGYPDLSGPPDSTRATSSRLGQASGRSSASHTPEPGSAVPIRAAEWPC